MKSKLFNLVIAALCIISATSCLKDDNRTIMLGNGQVGTDIPKDELATPNPDIVDPNTDIPNFQYIIEKRDKQYVVRMDMTGIQDPETKEYLRLVGTGGCACGDTQNVWLSIDDKPKGLRVYNNSDGQLTGNAVKNDFVFLVDNSGSMDDEADVIARDIVNWAANLNSKLDVRFGCVGYDGEITGAINMTSYSELSAYLNRSTGVKRTVGFAGSDADALKSQSGNYSTSTNVVECSMGALHFASDLFAFREGANRIYVNFTDEPNSPNQGKLLTKYSVHYLESQDNWNTSLGTIHTVFSEDPGKYKDKWEDYVNERPWYMSDYTGGTTLFTDGSFSGVSLDDLPITLAMQHSYIIWFTIDEKLIDGNSHIVRLTVKAEDGSVRAERFFNVEFKLSTK